MAQEKKNPLKDGVIVQAVGPVVDVRFEDAHLPEILTAWKAGIDERKTS